MVVCIGVRLFCNSVWGCADVCCVLVSGVVLMFVVYLVLLNVVCFLSLRVGLCMVSLWCDSCCAFCLICDACSFVLGMVVFLFYHMCRCCVFMSCVHPVTVINPEDPDIQFGVSLVFNVLL